MDEASDILKTELFRTTNKQDYEASCLYIIQIITQHSPRETEEIPKNFSQDRK